jgi:hypothetical protein
MDFRLISFERGKSNRRPCVKICGDELCTIGAQWGIWCNGRPLTY